MNQLPSEIIANLVKNYKEELQSSTKDIPVIHDSALLHKDGYMYAALYTKGQVKIIVDDYYQNLTEKKKEFVKHHELGHLKDGLNAPITLDSEIRADQYAASKVGRDTAIDTLKEIYRTLWLLHPNYCVTIPSRLKALGYDVSDMKLIIGNKAMSEEELRMMIDANER